MSVVVLDRDDDKRAQIAEDGTVTNAEGKVIGFINDDGTAGDADSGFLGEVLESGQVVNADDETVGYIDLGKATLRDASESFLASVTGDGQVKDRMELYVGQFRPFSYKKLKLFAIYVLLFDQKYVKDDLKSLIKPE
jgi:hypothetical protein